MNKVAIIMGSKSDLPKLNSAIELLKTFEIQYEVHVFSAHRTPDSVSAFARAARSNGFSVIIAAAGVAAHLAGAIAANTTLPIIGIPINASPLGGIDALLSTVQMPSGIPVATVGIDNSANAALLAIEMLAINDASLAKKLDDKRAADSARLANIDETLEA